MNLLIYFPEKYQNKTYAKIGDLMDLRPECFDSVNAGTSSILLFGGKRMNHPAASWRNIYKEEDDYHLSNLRFLKLFPLSGDPVASYRELQVKMKQWYGYRRDCGRASGRT